MYPIHESKKMRILDNISDKKLDEVTLCLTVMEAKELVDTLNQILNSPEGNHGHLPDYQNKKELTLCLYDEVRIDPNFHPRVKRLILEDQ